MSKQFYTEKDIEDLFNNGTRSLQVTDDVVLTELAYEKAKRLGFQLISDHADNPPAAPVRPYLSDSLTQHSAHAKPTVVSSQQGAPVASVMFQPQQSLPPALSQAEKGNANAIENRIRSAVIAKLGNQVDAKLLDNIIHRVVKGIGLK